MFGRLCAYLREREPDHVINYTILVFELDQAELDEATQIRIDKGGR
jgi:hypothetical protein